MRSPSVAGSGSAAATTSRGATSTPFTGMRSFESSPSLWSVFSTSMNSSPRPYLKVTRLQSIQRGTSEHLLVLDVDALDRPDPLREVEDLGLGERRGREPATVALPDHGRVEALLDRRPDGEGRGEVVAVDDEARAVANPDLVDLGEELVRRVAGEDVGRARLDPDADECEQALLLPGRRALELVVAELDADLLVRVRGVRLGEGHRHVEVRGAGVEARVEDRDVEERVDGVQDGVGARLPDQRDNGVLARRVDPMRGEAFVVELRRRRAPVAQGRSRPARSARRTSGVVRSRRRPSRHRLFRRRESSRRRGSTRTTRLWRQPAAAIRSAEIPGSEVM